MAGTMIFNSIKFLNNYCIFVGSKIEYLLRSVCGKYLLG